MQPIDMSEEHPVPKINLEKYRKEAYQIAQQALYSDDVKLKILSAENPIQIEMVLLAAAKEIRD